MSSPFANPFITDDDDWRTRATCRLFDPEMFFPVTDARSDRYAADVASAKEVCAQCPVMAQCLEATLKVPAKRDRHGVFGGLDPDEREQLRVRREAQKVAPMVARQREMVTSLAG
jgi:WhiB family redox-sensing transcriptional regulator